LCGSLILLENYFRFEELFKELGLHGTGDLKEDGSEYSEPSTGDPLSNEFLGNMHRMRAVCRCRLHEFTMKKLDLDD